MKKFSRILTSLFVFGIVFFGLFDISYALKPTPKDQLSGSLYPVIHPGAGFQSILGTLLIGSTQGLPGAVLQVISPNTQTRPAIFSSSGNNAVQSFFSVLQTAQFTQKMFIGFNQNDFSNRRVNTLPTGSYNIQRLNVKGGVAIANLDSQNNGNNRREICADAAGTLVLCNAPQTFTWRTDDWGPCTNGTQTRNVWCENNGGQTVNNNRCSGAQPAATQSCGNPDNGPLSWNGNPYRQCENGRVIAYIGVTGAEGQPVEFRRGSNGPWMNANNGNNGFTYEIPKYDNPNDTMPDTYCKEFRYRVPNLPNKSTNDVNNGVWGCVNTMTRTECPD